MPWQTTGNDQHGVDPYGVASVHIARSKLFSRNGDTLQAMPVERPGCSFFCRSLFDFHESQGAAAANNQVNLSPGDAHPLRKNSPATHSKPPGGKSFRPSPALFGLLPPRARFRRRGGHFNNAESARPIGPG